MNLRKTLPFVAALALVGCSSQKTPPKLSVETAQPVAIPVPAAPADATMFGYLKVADPVALAKSVIGPSVTEMAAARNVNLAEIKPGVPLGIFGWDPRQASPVNMPAVALLPIQPTSQLASMLRVNPAVTLAPLGPDSTVATMGEAGAALATKADALSAMLQGKTPFDVLVYVNAVPIMAQYGPQLRAGLQAMGPALAAASAKQGGLSAKSTMSMFEFLLSSLEQIKSVTVGARVLESAFELATIMQDSSTDAGGPLAVADLAGLLPEGDLKMQWNIRSMRKMADFYLKMYAGFLDEKPELKKQVLALVEDWTKVGASTETGLSMSYVAGKGLRAYGIMRVDNGPAAVALMHKAVKLMSTGPIAEAYKNTGMELSLKLTEKVRKVKGWNVDRYTYDFKVVKDDPALKLVAEKFSGLVYEVAQVGPYLLYAIGAPVEEVAEALFAGKATHPMVARKLFPAGGTLYLDMNVPKLWAGLRAIMPTEAQAKLPTMPDVNEIVSIWGYDGGATSYYKLQFPKSLVGTLGTMSRH